MDILKDCMDESSQNVNLYHLVVIIMPSRPDISHIHSTEYNDQNPNGNEHWFPYITRNIGFPFQLTS